MILSSCCHRGSLSSSLRPLLFFWAILKCLQSLPCLYLSSVHGFQSNVSLCPKLLAFCSTALNTNWVLCWLSPGLLTLHPDKCWLWQHPGFKIRKIQIYIHSPQHIFSQPQIFSCTSLSAHAELNRRLHIRSNLKGCFLCDSCQLRE